MTDIWKVALRNLAILVFGALPLAIAIVWIESLLFPLEWMRGIERVGTIGKYAAGLLFWVLVLIVPVLLGGVIHQIILRAIPSSWRPAQKRITILLTTPVIPVGFLLIGNAPEALFIPRALVAIIVALVFYGVVAKALQPAGAS